MILTQKQAQAVVAAHLTVIEAGGKMSTVFFPSPTQPKPFQIAVIPDSKGAIIVSTAGKQETYLGLREFAKAYGLRVEAL